MQAQLPSHLAPSSDVKLSPIDELLPPFAARRFDVRRELVIVLATDNIVDEIDGISA